MGRFARLLAALLLFAATIAAAPHGHRAIDHAAGSQSCATCVFASSSGARPVLPILPLPGVASFAPPVALVLAGGHCRPPLSIAPKNGPPAA